MCCRLPVGVGNCGALLPCFSTKFRHEGRISGSDLRSWSDCKFQGVFDGRDEFGRVFRKVASSSYASPLPTRWTTVATCLQVGRVGKEAHPTVAKDAFPFSMGRSYEGDVTYEATQHPHNVRIDKKPQPSREIRRGLWPPSRRCSAHTKGSLQFFALRHSYQDCMRTKRNGTQSATPILLQLEKARRGRQPQPKPLRVPTRAGGNKAYKCIIINVIVRASRKMLTKARNEDI
ncbi:DctP (periplasmic C4-dicarboxylate binding protein) [Anopheles sinensis]|uniref:DctP (Periplasmic C4-dicarboxylate binding protein) n=1 Tax=Anopheles sinensis TaxID=74873 RepID=A0A084W0D5_ANOSI|nr:DctP (periplasmic C4-dicarboxylate binding protein) [Anopheles sinensis]